MKYRPLGNTGLDVSVICLGTMTYGEQNTQEEGLEQLDYAFEHGVNFYDTAEMYSIPPRKETYGATEKIISHWDKLKTQRDKVILATKAVGPMRDTYIRGGNEKLNEDHLTKALHGSLERLGVDYIDLYQLHWPERKANFFGHLGFSGDELKEESPWTSFQETLSVLKKFQDQGKIRFVGLSNETPFGTMKYLEASNSDPNLPRMASIQNPYNLLNRSYEVGMSEISIRENIGLLAYSPLAMGVLTGKYLNGQKPEGARLTLFGYNRYNQENAQTPVQRYVQLAQKFDLDPGQMALSFVNSRKFLTSNIIGATKMDQLKSNIASADLELGEEVLKEIEDIHYQYSNPCP